MISSPLSGFNMKFYYEWEKQVKAREDITRKLTPKILIKYCMKPIKEQAA